MNHQIHFNNKNTETKKKQIEILELKITQLHTELTEKKNPQI